MPRPALLVPLLRQSVETWSLESRAFLLYGTFMLVAGYAASQVPVAGLPLMLALSGPLSAGPALATRRILLQERAEREDFLGGFHGLSRVGGLALLSLGPPVGALALWIGLQEAAKAPQILFWLAGLAGGCVLAYLVVALSVAPQVLLLESTGPWRAAVRGWTLVRPRWLPVAALQLLFLLLDALLALPTLGTLLAQQEPGLAQWLPLVFAEILLGPLQAILLTLLYFRLREESGGTLAHA